MTERQKFIEKYGIDLKTIVDKVSTEYKANVNEWDKNRIIKIFRKYIADELKMTDFETTTKIVNFLDELFYDVAMLRLIEMKRNDM